MFAFLLDGTDGPDDDAHITSRSPTPDDGAQHSDSERSRSDRDRDDVGSESDVRLDLAFLPGRPRRRRGRRYRGVGRRDIRGRGRGRGEASMAAGRRRGRPGGGSSSSTVGRGRGRRGGGVHVLMMASLIVSGRFFWRVGKSKRMCLLTIHSQVILQVQLNHLLENLLVPVSTGFLLMRCGTY